MLQLIQLSARIISQSTSVCGLSTPRYFGSEPEWDHVLQCTFKNRYFVLNRSKYLFMFLFPFP